MQDIIIKKANGVRTIILNRPKVKNAIDKTMFTFLAEVLNNDAHDNEIVVTIITGQGDYFTSGFDVSKPMQSAQEGDPEVIIDEAVQAFKSFITALINYPKILIALVNGPAVGVGVTMLGLCDVVYASDTATFQAPFSRLGLCPEGCSSFVFPQIFGRSVASEMLLFSRKLTADEALKMGLISRVFPHDKLEEFYQSLLPYGKMSLNVTRQNKGLIMWNLKSVLHKTNDEECRVLRGCFDSEDFARSVMAFMSRKSKL